MSEKCVFCKSDGLNSGSVLYEGSSCIVIRNKHPLSKGHVLVIPKAHYKGIYMKCQKKHSLRCLALQRNSMV